MNAFKTTGTRQHKYSFLIGIYLLVSLLIFSFLILFWSYHSSVSAIDKELVASFTQRQIISQSILENQLEFIDLGLKHISSDQKFLKTLAAGDKQEARRLLFKALDSDIGENFDVILVGLASNPAWVDASSSLYDIHRIISLITKRKTRSPKEMVFRFKSQGSDVTLLIASVPIIHGKSGKVIGDLFGGIVLNDNLSLLEKIRGRSRSQSVALFENGDLIGSTDRLDAPGTASLIEARKSIKEGDLYSGNTIISSYKTIRLFGAETRLEIGLSVSDQAFVDIKRSFQLKTFILCILSVAFFLLSVMIISYLTYPSLKRLLQYAEKVAAGNMDVSYLPGKIIEFNRIGNSMENMVQSLVEKDIRLKTLIRTLPDLVWLKDRDGRFLFCNARFERLLGAKEEEIIGKTDYDFMDKDLADFFREKDRIAIERGGPSVNEEEVVFADDGHKELLETIKTPLQGAKGEVIGVLGIARDITERKKSEQEKIKAQEIAQKQKRFALVGKISGKIAHDFNNILGAIMGNAELSLDTCREEPIKKTLKLILDQTVRGRNLTRNLVAFAKDQEPKQEFFQINEKIDLVINLLKKDLEGYEIVREYQPEIPPLLADPGMIEHAVVNLIQNAIHATSLTRHPRITVRIHHGSDTICLEIEDNGCGIPEEHLEDIFTPAFTLKGSNDLLGAYRKGIKGTGYGMANVKKYIEQHLGSLKVTSRVGTGTRFSIQLPVIRTGLTRTEKLRIQRKKSHSGRKILLVEDEPTIADIQSQVLSQAPCRHMVDLARNGKDALKLFHQNAYDLISLDYILPGGINGIDVYEGIRKSNKTIPVLFISGNIEFLESIKDLREKDPFMDHLSKPCMNIDYLDSINGLLDKTSFLTKKPGGRE